MYEPFIGMIMLVGWNFEPHGWAFCDGRMLSISQNTALFALLGTTYGGNGTTTFALPDLRGRVPVGMGTGKNLPSVVIGQTGSSPAANAAPGQPTVTTPTLGLNYVIALQGIFPSRA